MISIILAEDYCLVRKGLRALLALERGLNVVAEAADGLEAVELVEKYRPNLLVLNLMMRRLHGLEVIRHLQRVRLETKVLVVSMHSDEPYILEAFKAGAAGYLSLDSTPADLLEAIRVIMAHETYLSPSLRKRALAVFQNRQQSTNPCDLLTSRERLVLQFAAEGNRNAEIAKKLFVSSRTIETHRGNVLKKLNLKSQTDLVRFAIRNNLISA